MTATTGQSKIRSVKDIPGWFPWMDQQVFAHFLASQADGPKGDLVELGVYKGKSAALIGYHQRSGETFTVCDLFGDEVGGSDGANREENKRYYTGLNREQFEQNYLAIHNSLPVVVQGASDTIMKHVRPGSVRFVHVDASHLYEHVVNDIRSAREMLRTDGIVAFDDYRSSHTPGVSAAVWEAVFSNGLVPICVTTQKLYGTFGDAAPHYERLQKWLHGERRFRVDEQQIAGRPLARIYYPPQSRRPRVVGGSGNVEQSLQTLAKEVRALSGSLETALEQRPSVRAQRAIASARRELRARRGRD